MIDKPTLDDMRTAWENYDISTADLEYVDNILIGTWRHGTEQEFIAHRKSDDTYWAIYYRIDTHGDYNEFRDEDWLEPYQVIKQDKIITDWIAVKTQD